MARKKVKILEQIELTSAGAKGVSVGKTEEGKTVLVRNAVPGDVVDVQVNKRKRNYFEGKAIHFHKQSELRTEPVCKHFGVCGGCKWQNLNYNAQLSFKQNEVEQNLKRIGGFTNLSVQPIIPSSEQYFYRNKLEFSFSNARWLTQTEIDKKEEINDKNALGFHIPGMWSKVLDIEKCHLQEEPSNEIRNVVKEFAIKNELDFYDLYKQEGFLRTLMLRNTNLGEWLVLIQFYREEKENRENLLNHLIQKFPKISSLMYAINPKGNDSIYDLEIHQFYGEDYITEEMNGLKFKIGPKSFFQTNSHQALKLYEIAKSFAQLTGNELIYDLYTGTGTIAQFVANKAKKVVGVESVAEAIEAAKQNAIDNQITNCAFICGDMKEVLNDDFVVKHGLPDVVIVDPPRDGMHKKVVENLLKINPARIVYVSCNSATQARDLALMKANYTIKKVQPVDMFPQTHHVENVVLLEKI